MGAPGGEKTGGRKKGTPNKRSLPDARGLAERLGCDPLEVLLRFTMGDWEGLGFETRWESREDGKGNVFHVERIPADLRARCASQAAKYLYPQLKSIQHKGSVGGLLADLMALTPEERQRRIKEAEERRKQSAQKGKRRAKSK